MKIYYITYIDSQDRKQVEAFTSKTGATKRLSQIRAEVKAIRKQWEEFIINGTRGKKPPRYARDISDDIQTVEFDRNNEGMLEAFTYLLNKEHIWN